MGLELTTPTTHELGNVISELASWQQEGLPVQLHSGDLAWHWRFGASPLASALRVWTRDNTTVAIGFLDEPHLIRMALPPSADHDDELAEALVQDLEDPARGVVAGDRVIAEARFGTAFRSKLHSRGWVDGEPWSPLVRDLSDPVDMTGLRVEIVGPERAHDRVAVHRSAFDGSTFTTAAWHTMAESPAYRDARCLLGYDDQDNGVAAATVWSAGEGRPGLLEPVGVHRDHRSHGYGTAITVAAAAALQDMGASSATVATKAANTGAVAAYASAGFRRLPEEPDFVFTR
jgi:GNAT superfamily N-acetyltransferase